MKKYSGVTNADIPAAVDMISQLLSNYKNASYAMKKMKDGEMINIWLEKNSEIKKNKLVHHISEVEETIADRTAENIKNISDEIAAGVLEDEKENEMEKMDD